QLGALQSQLQSASSDRDQLVAAAAAAKNQLADLQQQADSAGKTLADPQRHPPPCKQRRKPETLQSRNELLAGPIDLAGTADRNREDGAGRRSLKVRVCGEICYFAVNGMARQ